MTEGEKKFLVYYGMIFFPLLLLFLRLKFNLDPATVAVCLTYLAGMHGWQMFDIWNKTP